MTNPYIDIARQQIGRPFRHRGRGPRYFDCAGLLVYVVEQCGHKPLDLRTYSPEPNDDTLRQMLRKNCGDPVSDPQPGDIGLFRFKDRPHHVAWLGDYLYGGLSMIHADAYAKGGCVVEHRLDDLWRKRMMEVYRYGP